MIRHRGGLSAFAGFLLLGSGTAYAYIGPGLGAGVITAVVGILSSIFIAIFAIIFYPIKRAWRRKKKKLATEADNNSVQED